MDWQLLSVAVIVAAALWYLGRATWRSLRPGNSGCGGGCGCSAKAVPEGANGDGGTVIPAEQLLNRLRNSSRP